MEIPGPETDELGTKAKELNAFIAADSTWCATRTSRTATSTSASSSGRQGEIVYKRYKATSDAYEGGMLGNSNPHDVCDEWIEKKGGGDLDEGDLPGRRAPRSAISASRSARRASTRRSGAAWR